MNVNVNPYIRIKLSELNSLINERRLALRRVDDLQSVCAERNLELDRVNGDLLREEDENKSLRARIAEVEAASEKIQALFVETALKVQSAKQPWDRETLRVDIGNALGELSRVPGAYADEILNVIEARYAPPQAKPAFDVEEALRLAIDKHNSQHGSPSDPACGACMRFAFEAVAREFTPPVAIGICDCSTAEPYGEEGPCGGCCACKDAVIAKLAEAQGEQQPPTVKESSATPTRVAEIFVTDADIEEVRSYLNARILTLPASIEIDPVQVGLMHFADRANARMQTMREAAAEDITELLRRGTRGVSSDAEWLNARLRGDAK